MCSQLLDIYSCKIFHANRPLHLSHKCSIGHIISLKSAECSSKHFWATWTDNLTDYPAGTIHCCWSTRSPQMCSISYEAMRYSGHRSIMQLRSISKPNPYHMSTTTCIADDEDLRQPFNELERTRTLTHLSSSSQFKVRHCVRSRGDNSVIQVDLLFQYPIEAKERCINLLHMRLVRSTLNVRVIWACFTCLLPYTLLARCIWSQSLKTSGGWKCLPPGIPKIEEY